jgi:hypothetical protein
MATGATPPLSNLHISNYNQPNSHTIDLTLDDEPSSSSNNTRENKRQRIDQHFPFDAYKTPLGKPFLPHASHSVPSPQSAHIMHGAASQVDAAMNSHLHPPSDSYRPAFAPLPAGKIVLPAPSFTPASFLLSNRMEMDQPNLPKRQIIDLTGSPSPPPSQSSFQNTLPPELPPKTPVCIGELTVTALVLYPVRYLQPSEMPTHDSDWAPIRFQYEHSPNKVGSVDTIHIKSPNLKSPNGEIIPGDTLGVVEQKVASSLGPMLGKGLIRIDGKVRRGMPNVRLMSQAQSISLLTIRYDSFRSYLCRCSFIPLKGTYPLSPTTFVNVGSFWSIPRAFTRPNVFLIIIISIHIILRLEATAYTPPQIGLCRHNLGGSHPQCQARALRYKEVRLTNSSRTSRVRMNWKKPNHVWLT